MRSTSRLIPVPVMLATISFALISPPVVAKPVSADRPATVEASGGAETDDATPTGNDAVPGIGFEKKAKHRLTCGLIVQAVGGPCSKLFATVPVPMDWPEQKVKIVDQDVSKAVRRIRYRTLAKGVKQMMVEIPKLNAGQQAKALVTFEIERQHIVAPEDRSQFIIPKRATRDLRPYLAPSPYTESRHPKIRTLAKQVVRDKETSWEQVEAIYDYVRENVKYENGPLKGALAALRDGTGDCEELSSLFIAMCRANKIPARTVWIPSHCYPEFYLTDAKGMGHWFPCQAAGDRHFGSMPEHRTILQKGDNFKVPEKPEIQRYVAEFAKAYTNTRGTGTQGAPEIRWIRQHKPID